MRTKVLNYLGRAIIMFLIINVIKFFISYFNTSNVENIKYEYGAFYINNQQIGYTFQESLGFILLLFIIPFLYDITKQSKIQER